MLSQQTKIVAIVGAVLILAAGGWWMFGDKPRESQVTQRGYHPSGQ